MEEGQAKNRNEAPLVTDGAAISGDTAVQNEPVFKDDKKKMSGGVIACIVILAVLAIGGIGFGVWAMLSQNDKIASLETDLKNCANSNNSENEVETVTCPDGTEIEVTDDAASEAINPEDYIYIGEWGIKIKKPENWTSYRGYEFTNGYPQAVDTFTIRESLTSGDAVDVWPVTEEYCDNITDNSKRTCISIGGDYYGISKLSGELAPSEEDPVSDDFWAFVTNPENYSKI